MFIASGADVDDDDEVGRGCVCTWAAGDGGGAPSSSVGLVGGKLKGWIERCCSGIS